MRRAVRVVEEFAQVQLPDERLKKRLRLLVECAEQSPSASWPRMCQNASALEATYRFLNNPRVSHEQLLEPHFAASTDRARASKDLLVLHDTTTFTFVGEREGLGITASSAAGFDGHFAMAVDENTGAPLGLLGLRTTFRHRHAYRSKHAYFDPDKESNRWPALVDDVERRLSDADARVVHVMDREADWYELFHRIDDQQRHFVIRAAHDRVLHEPPGTLADAMSEATHIAERDVRLSRRQTGRRPTSAQRRHPARDTRTAKLAITARVVTLKPPRQLRRTTSPLSVCVVRVEEIDPPSSDKPIEWTLVSNLPIGDALRIVDIYRRRWLIEEFFKALKTGCSYEKRQLESKPALLNALAILSPIAWSMLALRALSRSDAAARAECALSSQQIQVLRAMSKKPLPATMTVEDALYAVAAFGGHLRNNGPPGWQTLGAGFERLLIYEEAWAAARREEM